MLSFSQLGVTLGTLIHNMNSREVFSLVLTNLGRALLSWVSFDAALGKCSGLNWSRDFSLGALRGQSTLIEEFQAFIILFIIQGIWKLDLGIMESTIFNRCLLRLFISDSYPLLL